MCITFSNNNVSLTFSSKECHNSKWIWWCCPRIWLVLSKSRMACSSATSLQPSMLNSLLPTKFRTSSTAQESRFPTNGKTMELNIWRSSGSTRRVKFCLTKKTRQLKIFLILLRVPAKRVKASSCTPFVDSPGQPACSRSIWCASTDGRWLKRSNSSTHADQISRSRQNLLINLVSTSNASRNSVLDLCPLLSMNTRSEARTAKPRLGSKFRRSWSKKRSFCETPLSMLSSHNFRDRCWLIKHLSKTSDSAWWSGLTNSTVKCHSLVTEAYNIMQTVSRK